MTAAEALSAAASAPRSLAAQASDRADAAALHQQAAAVALDARAACDPSSPRPARRVAEWRGGEL